MNKSLVALAVMAFAGLASAQSSVTLFGVVDASVSGAANDFGVSLRSDGKVIAGVGSSTSGGFTNCYWSASASQCAV